MDYKSGNNLSKLKLILIGNKAVGKTSILNRIINNDFKNVYFPTNCFE